MVDTPLLTIATVAMSNPDELHKTLRSLIPLEQKMPSLFQSVVIDGTKEALLDYKTIASFPYLITYINEPDNGIYHAMNKALGLCNSEYILFLNSGDELHQGFCDDKILSMILSKRHDIIFGSSDMVSNGRLVYNKQACFPRLYSLHSYPGCHQSTIFRGSIAKSLQYSQHYRICSDYLHVLNFLRATTSYRVVPDVLSRFDLSGTSSKNQRLSIKETFAIQVLVFSKLSPIPYASLLIRLLSMIRQKIRIRLSQYLNSNS